jgi:hypothetical protein
LSDYPTDIAPLLTAVQLVRLRDRVRGSTKVDWQGWLGPMEGPEREARLLAEALNKRGRRRGAAQRDHERRSIELMLAICERDFAVWRSIFSDEAATVTRFLNLLADLQLNVTIELEELKSLNKRNERALQLMDGFARQLRATAAGEKTGGFDDDYSVYSDLSGIADSLERLKERTDEKAEDAVRLISLMTSSVDSQTLVDLFTGEV